MFRLRLIAKAQYHNAKVVVCGESYTSKTCGKCGALNDIGSSKNFECTECGFEIPKQVRAARNLSYAWNLKHLSFIGKFSS